MSALIKDLMTLFAKLVVTLLLAYMVFTGRLQGSLLAPLFEAVGHVFG
ncbi:hypothetical protein SFB10_2487 [Serratia liquefaciens]|nr:hypothetical protein [Serratia liquefaciens]CAB1217500.1 hypothetical protein SFB10_2487 [Serratia liquefaciens]